MGPVDIVDIEAADCAVDNAAAVPVSVAMAALAGFRADAGYKSVRGGERETETETEREKERKRQRQGDREREKETET